MSGSPLKRCECGEPIALAAGDGVRIRGIAVIVKGLGAVAVCRKCKCDVPIPIRLMTPDEVSKGDPALVLPKGI